MGHQLKKQRGFTLIELMIASLLGLIVIATVTGVFISTYQANSQNLKVVRMEQEMRAVMTLMTRDIRRSGTRELAWQTSLLGTDNPFATDTHWGIGSFAGEWADSCGLFAYDRDPDDDNDGDSDAADDALKTADRVGYRIRAGGIEARGTLGQACTVAASLNGWQGITDRQGWAVVNDDPDLSDNDPPALFFTTTVDSPPGVGIRTVIVTLDGAVNTRSADPTLNDAGNPLTAADCSGNTLDIVCRRLVEKVRMRNDAIL